MTPEYKTGFCIYIDTVCQGSRPIERKTDGFPVVYDTIEEAQRSIAEDVVERLEQFLRGEREFEDAMTVEEYVVPVMVTSDGAVIDEHDQFFGKDF
jgi:hypothetical protein